MTRSHPRRIVSPSSSPDPTSHSVVAPPVTKRIFGDDDSELTDLTEDDGLAKKTALEEDAEPEDQDGTDKAGEPDDVGEMLEEEEGDIDNEQDGEETNGEDDVVDEEYAIRITASQPKDWVEWETVRVSNSLMFYHLHPLCRYVLHSRSGRHSHVNSKTVQA
jgi:hypothetical protein